jgi:hypothetical protein
VHPSKYKIQNWYQIFDFFSLRHSQYSLLLITSPFSICKSIACNQPTRKTRGHCLATFRAVNFILTPVIYIMSLTTPIPNFFFSHQSSRAYSDIQWQLVLFLIHSLLLHAFLLPLMVLDNNVLNFLAIYLNSLLFHHHELCLINWDLSFFRRFCKD